MSGGKLTEDDAEDSSTTEDTSEDTSETTTEETTEDGDHNLDVDDDDIKPNPSDNDFEEIGGNDEPLVIKKIAQECNLENKNQTIYFPELHTTAYDGTIGINMTKASEAKVVDTVAYYNLVGGMEFTIKGMEEMKEIIEKLNKAADTYYNNGEEIISNYEYDMLFDKLVDFENKTGIILSDSPTQKVGSNVLQSSKLKKVTHKHPALSLDKTKSIDDLKSWLGDKLGVLSWKMDGLTGVATYIDM